MPHYADFDVVFADAATLPPCRHAAASLPLFFAMLPPLPPPRRYFDSHAAR
jgi:hypothetical protein